jgi:hypothetical protein
VCDPPTGWTVRGNGVASTYSFASATRLGGSNDNEAYRNPHLAARGHRPHSPRETGRAGSVFLGSPNTRAVPSRGK